MAAPDFAAEGLLDDLEDARDRDARLQLLEELHDAGVALDELRQAVVEERLTLLPLELELGGAGRYTQREVAEQAGVDLEMLARSRQAIGLPRLDPDNRVLTDADVDAARRGQTIRDAGLPDEQAIALLRVMGEAGARLAETVRDLVGGSLVRPGDTERDLGRRYARFARATTPQLGDGMAYVATVHLRELLRAADISRAERERGELVADAREVGVVFADLVGFTRLGSEVPASDLGTVAGRLEELVADRAEPPVRLIKMIGDAAMLVSPEPAPLLDATLDLVEAADAEGHEFPQLRAGIALGPALNRAGDWYGHTVNLASRVCSIARPGSVLATREVHDEFPDDYRWSLAGEHRLKGIDERAVLFRARPREPDEDLPT